MLGTMLGTIMGGKEVVEGAVSNKFSSMIANVGRGAGMNDGQDQCATAIKKDLTPEDKLRMLANRAKEKERLTKEADGEFMGWKKDQLEKYGIVREFHHIEGLKSVSPSYKYIMSKNLSAKRDEEAWKDEAKKGLLNFDKFWSFLG